MKDKDDFAVVLQTFTENFIFPLNRLNNSDLSFLSIDCFHLSQKGYAMCKNMIYFVCNTYCFRYSKTKLDFIKQQRYE